MRAHRVCKPGWGTSRRCDRSHKLYRLFPDAVGMTGGVAVVANKKDSRPEIVFQTVLRLHCGEIVAGRNDAAVEDDEVVLSGGKKDWLLRAGTKGKAGQKDGRVIGKLAEQTGFHTREEDIRIMVFITQSDALEKPFFVSRNRF